MKTKILILALMSMVIISCNKKDDDDTDDTPTPVLSIRFGHIGNFYDFIPFTNQSVIDIDTIAAYSEFAISIVETDLPDVGDLTTDSLSFQFDVITEDDIEHFNSKLNISSSSSYIFSFGQQSEIGADFGLPYKIGSPAVPGNDTIEFNSIIDSVTVNYVSNHSILTGSKSAEIVP